MKIVEGLEKYNSSSSAGLKIFGSMRSEKDCYPQHCSILLVLFNLTMIKFIFYRFRLQACTMVGETKSSTKISHRKSSNSDMKIS